MDYEKWALVDALVLLFFLVLTLVGAVVHSFVFWAVPTVGGLIFVLVNLVLVFVDVQMN